MEYLWTENQTYDYWNIKAEISTSQRRFSFSLQAVCLPTELSGIHYVTDWCPKKI
jgi:hypothetical protein